MVGGSLLVSLARFRCGLVFGFPVLVETEFEPSKPNLVAFFLVRWHFFIRLFGGGLER